MLKYVFDLETLINYFCACFVAVDDPTDRHAFEIYKGHSDFEALMEFLDQEIMLIGFNNLKFDDIILKAMMGGWVKSVKEIQKLASNIINNSYDNIPNYWDIWNYPVKFLSFDVMELNNLKRGKVSLKFAGVIIKHPKIQDLPISPNEFVEKQDYPKVLKYCFNDCEITRGVYLYDQNQDELLIREELQTIFGVDVHTLSRPKSGKEILLNMYSQSTSIPIKELKKQNSDRKQVAIKDCIVDNLVFYTPYLQDFRRVLESLVLYKNRWPLSKTLVATENGVENYNPSKHKNNNKFSIQLKNFFKYETNIEVAGKTFNIGIGGIHTQDEAEKYESNDEYDIVLADVSSYYPSTQSVYRIRPEHLEEAYNEALDDLITRKFISQAEGQSANKTYGLKIIINAAYGQMGDIYSPFLDQKAMITVTMSGQLFLLDLIEKVNLTLNKTKLISANTDGVLYLVHKSEREKFRTVCETWASRVGLQLDYDPFKLIVMRDVNNYLGVKENGKVKTKGAFIVGDLKNGKWQKPLEKGYDAPVVAIALYKYFVDGIPVAETINNHQDIYDFMLCQKVGSQFEIVAYDGEDYYPQQKTTRYIITSKGISLVKRHKDTGKIHNFVKGELMQVLNDVHDEKVENYPIRYGYYINRAIEIINLVEPRQEALF